MNIFILYFDTEKEFLYVIPRTCVATVLLPVHTTLFFLIVHM